MTKNIRRILFASVACCNIVATLTSCSDYLETPSQSAVSGDDMYATAANVDQVLTGVYGCLKPFSTYYFIMSENRSDNLFETTESTSRDEASCAQFNSTALVSSNMVMNCWADHYKLIAAANSLIVNQGRADGLTTATKNQYEAEARFLRALSYFDLVRYFGRIPLSLKELTSDEAFQLPQSEPLEVYNNAIIPDLKYAIAHLGDAAYDYNGKKHSERATLQAAKALLGKVYMQMAGYPLLQDTKTLAKDVLKEVIDSWDFTEKWAATIDDWNRMWLHENDNKYFLFEIQYIAEKNQGNPAAALARPSSTVDDQYCSAYLTSGQHIYLNRELQKELVYGYRDAETNAKQTLADIIDKRVYNTINIAQWYDEETGRTAGGDPESNCFVSRFFEHKMKRDSLGFGNMDATIIDRTYWPQNWPILRIEDVMLLYAECVGNTSNGKDGGIDLLNMIRTRAGWPALPASTPQSTFDTVLKYERRIELLGEGHRWFDEVRQNTFVKDIQQKMLYYKDFCDATHSDAYQVYANRVTQDGALYPIPIKQMRISGGLYKQNPGYN